MSIYLYFRNFKYFCFYRNKKNPPKRVQLLIKINCNWSGFRFLNVTVLTIMFIQERLYTISIRLLSYFRISKITSIIFNMSVDTLIISSATKMLLKSFI